MTEKETCLIAKTIEEVAHVQGRLRNNGSWSVSAGILQRALERLHKFVGRKASCCKKCDCRCKCGG